MLDFYKQVYKLKNLERKGWVIKNIKDPETHRVESDAEHICSMCLLSLKVMQEENLNLNKEKVLKMCLYHELGEIFVGDITPFDHISRQEKFNKEKIALEEISEIFKMPEVLELWQEFEQNQTAEAKFVKIMDKLDMLLQAKIYSERIGDDSILQEMIENSKNMVGYYIKYI